MDHNYPRNRGRSGWSSPPGSGPAGDVGKRKWSTDEIARLMREHPEYRLRDDPFTCQLIQMVLADPDDLDAHELLTERVRYHQLAFLGSGDAFWGNYPAPGSLTYPSDFLHVGQMPTGDVIGLVISQLPGNVGVLGPTRSGKTTLLAHVFISNPHWLQSTCVCAFVKKPELRHLVTVPQIGGGVHAFNRADLAFCYMEGPDNTPEAAWKNESVRLLAQCYARFSAQRLLGEIVNDLMANHPEGAYPTLRQIADALDAFKPRWGSREAGYRESISYVLKDLLNCTGNMWDYSSSTFLNVLTGSPGLAIIELEDLPQEHFTFIVTYVARWIYFRRLYGGEAVL
jgi:hypothetical protein